MNRLILKYGYPLTVIILVVLAWVVFQRVRGGSGMIPLIVVAAIVWVLGVPTLLWFWPWITVNGFKRAFTRRGLGGGPIPVNTLYAVPLTPAAAAGSGSLLATGTDDVLYVGGWLDLGQGPLELRVPEMDGRYYILQFTDPSSSANFAYVGRRTTGTGAGTFLLTGPRWTGSAPDGMGHISFPHRSALVIGRVFTKGGEDVPRAYGLARQIEVAPYRGAARK